MFPEVVEILSEKNNLTTYLERIAKPTTEKTSNEDSISDK